MAPERPPWFDRFSAVLDERLGLSFDAQRAPDLAAAMRRRTVDRGRDVQAYLDGLADDDAELRALGDLVTVGETFFFRGAEHFAILAERAIPARSAARGRELRVLSAGCSTGEEPYSIAIALREYTGSRTFDSVRIDAVDISAGALAKARAGVYGEWSLRETSAARRERWFTRRGRSYAVRPEIRAAVGFRQENLASLPASTADGTYDVVFCRNVLMYFSPAGARRVLASLARVLAEDGVLFVGHAETLRGLTDALVAEAAAGAFFYRHRGAPPAVPALEPARRASEPWAAPPLFVPPSPPPAPPPPIRPAETSASRARLAEAVTRLDAADLAGAEAIARELVAGGDAPAADAYVVLALAAEHRGDARAAIELHRAAIYLAPEHALAHLHEGRLLRRGGAAEAARRALEMACDLLAHEDDGRLELLGGQLSRAGLVALCRGELRLVAGAGSKR